MIKLPKLNNYIVIKNIKELNEAKSCSLCRYIVYVKDNIITIWNYVLGKWVRYDYVFCDRNKEVDTTITGLIAYQKFYKYCGKDEVERMKLILNPIELWESTEQLHYFNYEYSKTKLYQPIYEFDANSAFTYGAFSLPDGFEKLKEYMTYLYDEKKEAQTQLERSKFKNLQNFLIGYFARIKNFIRVRSDIIEASNANIKTKMAEIVSKKGIVYLSNTDSIVTDERGAEIMQKYIGDNVGQFKINNTCDKLFYRSSNCYQLGEKIVYSGVGYFARKNTDFFKDRYAEQKGNFIKTFNFCIDDETKNMLCRVELDEIVVTVKNLLGEVVETKIYKLKES